MMIRRNVKKESEMNLGYPAAESNGSRMTHLYASSVRRSSARCRYVGFARVPDLFEARNERFELEGCQCCKKFCLQNFRTCYATLECLWWVIKADGNLLWLASFGNEGG